MRSWIYHSVAVFREIEFLLHGVDGEAFERDLLVVIDVNGRREMQASAVRCIQRIREWDVF